MADPASEADPASDVAQFRKWEYQGRKVGEAKDPWQATSGSGSVTRCRPPVPDSASGAPGFVDGHPEPVMPSPR